MRNFIKDVIDNSDISFYDTNVAVTTYGNDATADILLKDHTDSSTLLKQAVDNIAYGMGTTRTHLGLYVTYNTTFIASNGDRSIHPNVCLFVTDGTSVDRTATKVIRMFHPR